MAKNNTPVHTIGWS